MFYIALQVWEKNFKKWWWW